jgi:hypothetical protein
LVRDGLGKSTADMCVAARIQNKVAKGIWTSRIPGEREKGVRYIFDRGKVSESLLRTPIENVLDTFFSACTKQ